MTSNKNDREYELVLLGASGYTGKFTAEYITKNFPRDLKWAVAGRNYSKLAAVIENLQSLDPSRPPPEIETVSQIEEELDVLAQKTRLLITTVGPYQDYGSPAFRSCARKGTHYLDCTGEMFWVGDMIKENDEIAKKNGAIMISAAGFDCVPSDISTWVAVDHIRRTFSAPTARLDLCIHSAKGGVSGGTLASAIQAFDRFGVFQLARLHAPYAISPAKPSPNPPLKPTSIWTKLLGLLKVKELGWMGYQPQAAPDRAIVHRSWGLLKCLSSASTSTSGSGLRYGENFDFHAWMKLPGPVTAVIWHFSLITFIGLFLLSPVRWFLKRFWYAPGQGASREQIESHWVEFRGVAAADRSPSASRAQSSSSSPSPEKALVRFRYDSDPYILTGLTLAEAARVILRGKDTDAHKIGGGVLTTATLGQQYVERLRAAGVKIDVKTKGEGSDSWGTS